MVTGRYADLNGSEARLLLVLSEFGQLPVQELMLLSGINSKSRYYAARKRLAALGLLPRVLLPAEEFSTENSSLSSSYEEDKEKNKLINNNNNNNINKLINIIILLLINNNNNNNNDLENFEEVQYAGQNENETVPNSELVPYAGQNSTAEVLYVGIFPHTAPTQENPPPPDENLVPYVGKFPNMVPANSVGLVLSAWRKNPSLPPMSPASAQGLLKLAPVGDVVSAIEKLHESKNVRSPIGWVRTVLLSKQQKEKTFVDDEPVVLEEQDIQWMKEVGAYGRALREARATGGG